MAHPFSKMFEAALKKSTPLENLVLEESEALRQKGYSVEEIYNVLKKLHQDLVQDKDLEVIKEALDEFETYMGE